MNKKELSTILKENIVISILFIFIITTMTIGFANYSEILNTKTTLSMLPQDKIEITNIEPITISNVTIDNITYDKSNINLNLTFNNEESIERKATYKVTIRNNTFYDYTYIAPNFEYNITSNLTPQDKDLISIEITSLDEGDIIRKNEEKEFEITIKLKSDDNNIYDLEGNINLNIESLQSGNILGVITGNNIGDLTGNNIIAPFKINVINSYQTDERFKISLNNDHYEIVDENIKPINELKITKNSEQEFTFYVKKKEESIITTAQETTTVILEKEGQTNINCGKITLLVDYIEEIIDNDPPIISNVSPVISNEIGVIDLSWEGYDLTAISKYVILIYKNNTLIDTKETISDEKNISITNLEPGEYYFKVYGIDTKENQPTEKDINNATEIEGPCSKSKIKTYKWVFNIKENLTNLKSNGPKTININEKYESTLTPSSNRYDLPDNIEIKMNNKTLTKNQDYTYNNSTGKITIEHVTGDIEITASNKASCLAEGTKILLSDNTYKKIEDITYQDLLKVWNYEEGKITYEYPIWIEQTKETNTYKEIILEDNNTLKVIGKHAVFNVKENKFIDVNNLNINDEIYTVKKDKLVKTKVIDIKIKQEKIKYYHVITTRYYNIIANNILTTDGTVELSNLHDFKENLIWKTTNNKNLYKYEELQKYIPKYLFYGLRMEDAKNLNLSKQQFIKYIEENITNKNMLLPPIKNKYGKRLFMITTDINELGSKYLKEENTYYILPINKNIKYYLNTTNNKYYIPGSIIKVETPIHFIKIYK